MKKTIIYSSQTGNTKQVAQAIHSIFPVGTKIFPVEEAPDPKAFDFLALGYWVDKGTADAKMKAYMEQVKGKKVATFGTLGAYPESEHGQKVLQRVAKLLEENEILASFLCQGRVDPTRIFRMDKAPLHKMTPERRARLDEAAKHPNEEDFANARKVFSEVLTLCN